MSRKQSFLGTALIILSVVVLFVGFIYAKNWYYKMKQNNVIVSWKGTAYEWTEKYGKDSSAFVSALKGNYIEIEGILLNVATTQGATTIYFTSGFQTDSSYLVGQQPDWLAVEHQTELSACDSLILMYGRQYNFQRAPIPVIFSGDAVNADSDQRLIFSYFEDCRHTQGKSVHYRLNNFCAQTVKVRALLIAANRTDKGLQVELDEVMVLSREKNKIKFQ